MSYDMPGWMAATFDPSAYKGDDYLMASVPYKDLAQMECCVQAHCGLAFDFGREQGNLEVRQVLLDAEMMRCCDERARAEIERLREEVNALRLKLDRREEMIDRASIDDDWAYVPQQRDPWQPPLLSPEMRRAIAEGVRADQQRIGNAEQDDG